MNTSQTDLAALIGSRICHDLISPIGAINNGLELLSMTAAASSGPEVALIHESVSNASARIRFFRLAFGAATDQGISSPEIRDILKALTENSKFDVQWQPQEGASRADVRMAFLAQLCLEAAMPYGGQITILFEDGQWVIAAESSKFKDISYLFHALEINANLAEIVPALVQFPLLAKHCKDMGKVIKVMQSETDIAIRITA